MPVHRTMWSALAIACTTLVSTIPALAAESWRLRDVSVQGEVRSSPDAVRESLRTEFARVENSLARRAPADLSIVVTRTTKDRGGIEIVVSAAVLDGKSGELVGNVQGSIVSSNDHVPELALVQQAASGAFARLPSMVRPHCAH